MGNFSLSQTRDQFINNCTLQLYILGVENTKYSETQYAQICYNRAKILADVLEYNQSKEIYNGNIDLDIVIPNPNPTT